ncbi:MAG: transcription-repair coupling factor, partial [Inquilinus sp.]|nr:transcription-repair coupling factor [Inquilinus sp.]
MRFFDPDLEVQQFPAWDCLPYDRVSPHPDIVGQRVDTLIQLLTDRPGRVVVTTVNGLLQRVPPRAAFADTAFTAQIGSRVDVDALQAFLVRNGYAKAQTVRETGEYAVRGGIVDLFPPTSDLPLRLDLFGDELEAVRAFDPITQRTSEPRSSIRLTPMAELQLDPDSIARFRSGYRELFGAVAGDDPLYESISAGRRHPGMEHWLPLFHDTMETLLDYTPGAVVTLDPQMAEAATARFSQIADFHDARQTMRRAEKRGGSEIYKPLPADRLYLDQAALDELLDRQAVARFSPFGAAGGGPDAGGRRGRDFVDARSNPDINVFDSVLGHI